MTAPAYPTHIKPLTSLRFIAAIWVLLYHFKDHLSLGLGRIGLIADGYLGVDLFFILSGFILAHVYLDEVETRGFNFHGFLQNRLARIYPMHLATLAVMLALFAAASLLGVAVGEPDAFKLRDIPAHLALVHAWGVTQSVGWNFPSWSISAEWGAYLLFPLIAMLVLRAQKYTAWMLGAALALCLANFVALDNLHFAFANVGRAFEEMTAQIGMLRIVPSFMLGVALYVFGRKHAAPAWAAWPITLGSLYFVILVATLQLWDALAWFGLAGLIYGLAETARHTVDAPVAGSRFVFLGAASYALYMTHLPVDIVWFHTLEKFGVTEQAPWALRLLAVFGVFGACVLVSAFAYLWLEEPARKWVRGLRFSSAPAPQPSAAPQ